MTVRSEVVAAFELLHRETGRVDFAPVEIIGRVRVAGSAYQDSSIRTHVVSTLLDDGTLIRSARGLYRLARHAPYPAESGPQSPRRSVLSSAEVITEDEVKEAVRAALVAGGMDRRCSVGSRARHRYRCVPRG